MVHEGTVMKLGRRILGKIGIITDSTCDIPQEFFEKYDIEMISTRIIYKDAEYRDRLEISAAEIYDNFNKEIPKTSMPSPSDFIAAVERFKEREFDKIICIFVSSGLSGTYGMAVGLSREMSDIKIEIVDSKSLSLGLGYVVMDTAVAISEGASFEEALEVAKKTVDKIRVYFALDTLHYLRIGGRIGRVEGTIAEFLNLKPIITISHEDGKYRTYKKVRGIKKAINSLEKIVRDTGGNRLRVATMHGHLEDKLRILKPMIEGMSRVVELDFGQISPVLSVHTGPGLIGVVIQELD